MNYETCDVPVTRFKTKARGVLPETAKQSKLIKCEYAPKSGGCEASVLVTVPYIPAKPKTFGKNVETLLYVQALTRAYGLSKIGASPLQAVVVVLPTTV